MNKSSRSPERVRLKKHGRSRKGGALVEMILVLPVLIIIFLGSIEATNLLFLQQATTEAAYDGAIRGVRPGATEAEVDAAVRQQLTARDITVASVEAGSATDTLEDVPPGDLFTVSVTINTADHLISPVMFADFSEIEVTLTARKQ